MPGRCGPSGEPAQMRHRKSEVVDQDVDQDENHGERDGDADRLLHDSDDDRDGEDGGGNLEECAQIKIHGASPF